MDLLLIGGVIGFVLGVAGAYYFVIEIFRLPTDRAERETLLLRAEAAEAVLRVAQAGQIAEHQLIMRVFPSPADMPPRRPGRGVA
jgi:hypothetical protein